MSDSDSDSDYGNEWDYHGDRPTCLRSLNTQVVYDDAAHLPPEEIFDRWSCIPIDTRKEAAQMMKVCAFWLPILLQREVSTSTVAWAFQIGLIDSNPDLSLKQIHKIDILEAILKALEMGTLKKDATKHVMWISNMFSNRSPPALEDALHWLERTGEPAIRRRVNELGHQHCCFTALALIFTEFAKYIQDMGSDLEKTMKALMAQPPASLLKKSEEMKKLGNANFAREKYDDAVRYYSDAIKFFPDNHIYYGNRALCFIRSKKYLKAVGDGKRAILIKPLWAKGHYRYCEALFSLGEVQMAVEANRLARSLCKGNAEGIRDLEQQHQKFISEMETLKATRLKKIQSKSAKDKAAEPRSQSVKPDALNYRSPHKATTTFCIGNVKKVTQVKTDKQSGKSEKTSQADMGSKDSKPTKSELSSKNGKGDASAATKKKTKNRNSPTEMKEEKIVQNQKTVPMEKPEESKAGKPGKAGVLMELRSVVQDAHSALTDQRSRNAEQAFNQAHSILNTNTHKELGLSKLDVLLLLYGRATALTDIGQPEALSEALSVLENIKTFEERTIQSMIFYAIGRIYHRENRFSCALQQFSDALQVIKNQIMPGKLTWPLTKEIVKETQTDYLKEIVESAIESCRFPPAPDATCRLEKCLRPFKTEIYFTDPDFKGFIQICCCQSCIVEYHIACWKIFKTSEKNEKDFLQDPCLTPDCIGQICCIKIIDPTGLVKCKFEAAIPKLPTPKKIKVKQQCTSLKKLKSKEEHRLKRRQHKQSFQEKQSINDEILQQDDDSATHSQHKAWLLYRDRVLLQIYQHMDLLSAEKNLHVSALTLCLKPWLELDSLRGNQLAQRMLQWGGKRVETVAQNVELLLDRKNRVWARVFIEMLSGCLDINPKLHSWACQLNDAGLSAAKSFIDLYAGHLETLDLASLLNFEPLQEVILQKLGTRPELFSTIGMTVTEFLKQAPPQDMRLFIWTLEEHRDAYESCGSILDEYFDMMDGNCSVLKKSDENENENNSPKKSRRKRPRENRKAQFWSNGSRSLAPRDDIDQDNLEDEALSWLDPGDSFTVPSHLRERVADFEEGYSSTKHSSHYKKILDNNPDPTKESLYDYFAQILDEHGPLVADDALLVGELVNFPSVAQHKIQECGGFETFLLESLRFIKMGRCIGLAKHAVSLQQAGYGGGGASLDDLDDFEDTNSSSSDFAQNSGTGLSNGVLLGTPTKVFPVLPNPYLFSAVPAPPRNPFFPTWRNNGGGGEGGGGSEELDIYRADEEYVDFDSLLDQDSSSEAEENWISKKHAEVQTCPAAMRSVSVNTEHYERFERSPGGISLEQRSNRWMESQIQEIQNGGSRINSELREEIAQLEEDLQKINANIQVTNTELVLFQQKLEEEVKNDQREKRNNQEVLRGLKQELETLLQQHASLTQNIGEKKSSYETKLRDFVQRSNQSAAEKMSLDDEIKRCKVKFTATTRRSLVAQLSVVESVRDQSLFGLYRDLRTAKTFLSKLDEFAHRFPPNQHMDMTRNSCRANIQDIEKKISTTESQFMEQSNQVKTGRRISEFPPVAVNRPEPAAAAPVVVAAAAAREFLPSPSSSSPRRSPLLETPPPQTLKQPIRSLEPQKQPIRTPEPHHGNTVFDKAMERLSAMFPDYSRSDLMRFVASLRSSTGGSLSNMTLQDMVGGVTMLILDQQERQSSVSRSGVGGGSPAQRSTPPPPVWHTQGATRNTDLLNKEDPCIICHDDMSPDDVCVLGCRHGFHNKCIRSWLREQSTCPTCRDHALLPEEFPVLLPGEFPALHGRKRQC